MSLVHRERERLFIYTKRERIERQNIYIYIYIYIYRERERERAACVCLERELDKIRSYTQAPWGPPSAVSAYAHVHTQKYTLTYINACMHAYRLGVRASLIVGLFCLCSRSLLAVC
jgi:hypothetical protein